MSRFLNAVPEAPVYRFDYVADRRAESARYLRQVRRLCCLSGLSMGLSRRLPERRPVDNPPYNEGRV